MANPRDANRAARRQALDQAEEFIDDVREQAGDRWDRVKQVAKKKGEAVQDYAEGNPWHLAAAGVVVGFLLATLIQRRD